MDLPSTIIIFILNRFVNELWSVEKETFHVFGKKLKSYDFERLYLAN